MSYVAAAFRPNAAHHLRLTTEAGHARTECGTTLARPDFNVPPHLAECRSCAEHVYARENRTNCPHCHKRPRR